MTFSPLSRVKTNPRSKNSIQIIQIYISELRGRFFSLFFSFFFTFCTLYFYSNEYFYFLVKPLNLARFIFTDILEGFQTYLQLSFVLTLFFLLPFLIYQVFCFFLPGLFEYEKRYYFIYWKSFTFFYFLSFFFSWYILLPVLWSFFMQFEIHKELICIQLEARILTNIQFILKTFTISQFVFQFPLLCFFSIKKFEINPKQSKFVQQNRSLFYILILLFCSLFSPPEIFFQLLSSLFFIIFFESIIFFIYLSEYYRSH